MNDKGAESYRAQTMAEYQGNEKGKILYIGFGVNNYRDRSLNLEYADKDARDLADLFSSMAGRGNFQFPARKPPVSQ